MLPLLVRPQPNPFHRASAAPHPRPTCALRHRATNTAVPYATTSAMGMEFGPMPPMFAVS